MPTAAGVVSAGQAAGFSKRRRRAFIPSLGALGMDARRIQTIAPCGNQVEMLKEAPSIKTTQG